MKRPVDDMAADWAVRIDAGPLGDPEQAELDRWLAADERNAGALLRAEAMLAWSLRACGADAPEVESAADELDDPDVAPEPSRVSRRTWLRGAGGGLIAASFGGFLFFRGQQAPEIATAVGEVRRVPLGDGSIAAVNTASRIKVALGDTERRIDLEDGEAFFEVAHDKARPFIVSAGRVRVRAVGTAFSVRRREGGADVLVTQGVVETWIEGSSRRTRIEAGSRSFVPEAPSDIAVSAAPQEIDRALAWRSGELALDGESVGYAVAELNRYNAVKIEVGEASIGSEPLVGYFKTNDPRTFADAVAAVTGARAVEEGGVIRLVR